MQSRSMDENAWLGLMDLKNDLDIYRSTGGKGKNGREERGRRGGKEGQRRDAEPRKKPPLAPEEPGAAPTGTLPAHPAQKRVLASEANKEEAEGIQYN